MWGGRVGRRFPNAKSGGGERQRYRVYRTYIIAIYIYLYIHTL